jgi:hypothetical protein
MLQTPPIFDGQAHAAICHSYENLLLHHMGLKTVSRFAEISYIASVKILRLTLT